MVKVYTPGTPDQSRPGRLLSCLLLMLIGVLAAPAQAQEKGASGKAAEPAKAAPAEGAEPAGDDAEGDDQAPGDVPPDPSKTQRVGPVQIFKDPIAEELLNLKKFNPIRSQQARPEEIAAVKTMAQNPNMPVDSTTIRRMVNGMVGQLTDTRNIQALIDPPPGQSSNSTVAQAIEQSTSNLMEPLFVGRANKSTRFLAEYNRVLLAALQPLLKHHLVPRVQAMMVLAEGANPEALKVFLDELKNPQQTVWVKLWALRGITNIKQLSTARLTAAQEIDAARAIAALLEENKELPWPVQLRALEALTALRQGFVPASPRSADMAASVMRVLADPRARTEVRSEAARALGFMQITTAVDGYNYGLVAYAVAMLAADLGDQVVNSYEESGTPLNETRAQLMTSLLVGPIIQAFEGQSGVRDSGLLHVNASVPRADLQKVLDQVKPVAAASLELLRAPSGQRKARRADLVARVAALREFLSKNPPANKHLVPDDQGFLQAADAQAGPAEADQAKVAGRVVAADGQAESGQRPDRPAPILVPELRDYQQINAELVRRLNRGETHVRLEGVERQRLLVSGLSGPWRALIEVDGNAGPELAAGLDAPGVTVVCRGSAADGAGRGLAAGTMVVLGTAGTAVGYVQSGGLIVVAREVGPRAGLGQRGGDLVLLGGAGPLCGERQSGGRLFLAGGPTGPHLRADAWAGRLVVSASHASVSDVSDPEDRQALDRAISLVDRLRTGV